jgi:hypothetical protein
MTGQAECCSTWGRKLSFLNVAKFLSARPFASSLNDLFTCTVIEFQLHVFPT